MSVPWTKIKADWLKGGTSYKKLAEKYKVSASAIGNRASKEGWGKQNVKIGEKVSNELGARVAHARVNHLEKLIQANEALLDGLVKLAEEIRADPRMLLMDKSGSLKSAESFAKSLQVATETQRDLYRLPTIDQKFAAKKWREQLKLEQSKTQLSDNGDQQLMLVIHEPAEEGAANE